MGTPVGKGAVAEGRAGLLLGDCSGLASAGGTRRMGC